MSQYHGACDGCGETSGLTAVDRGGERRDKLCFTCYDRWLEDKPPAPEPLRQDPDDERKYGRYNY